jgi:hypothetical protein
VTVVTPVDQSIITKNNINKVVPTNMSPGTDPNLFYTQLSTGMQLKATQTLVDTLMQSPGMKDAGVTKTVDNVQKAATPSISAPASGGVTNKFSLDVKYDARTAAAKYTGYFNFTTTYMQSSNNLVTVLGKNLSKDTVLSLQNVSPMGQFTQQGYLSLSHTF